MNTRDVGSLLSEEDLTSAIEQANVPTLLLVLTQLTGDLSWLDEPYRPTRPVGLDDNDSGGLPPQVQRTVRDAARGAIRKWLDGAQIAMPDPDTDQIVQMLSVAVGEEVPPEYGPMIHADISAAIASQAPERSADPAIDSLDVLVIGAGVSGICAGVRLQQAGIRYSVLERNADVGGVWAENRYPAAGVDTPSHLYSFSFAPHDWPRWFGAREHIHLYLKEVADRFGVAPKIKFNTAVERVTFDASTQGWIVETVDAAGARRTVRSRVVISAVGAFNNPVIPKLPGLDSFAGQSFHSARWPEDLSLADKRVAVVGNGASAMQIVPAIADQAASLAIFQLEPQWAAPFAKCKVLVPDAMRRLLEAVPLYHAWYRARLAWTFNDKPYGMLRKDPEWPHPERSLNKSNDRFREYLTNYIKEELGDRTDLLTDLVPTYPPFGKRMLLDNGWYRTLRLPSVRLVTQKVTEIRATGLVTEIGEEIPADVIVYATGFDVVHFLSTLEVVGRSGQSMREAWHEDNAQAYLGLAVPDFPNFFILYGPNTQSGHGGSLIGGVEAQLNHIIKLITEMDERGLGTIEVRRDVYERYNRTVEDLHAQMVWTHPGMETYYRNSQGRVVVNSPFRVVEFWEMTDSATIDDYELSPRIGHAADGGSSQ